MTRWPPFLTLLRLQIHIYDYPFCTLNLGKSICDLSHTLFRCPSYLPNVFFYRFRLNPLNIPFNVSDMIKFKTNNYLHCFLSFTRPPGLLVKTVVNYLFLIILSYRLILYNAIIIELNGLTESTNEGKKNTRYYPNGSSKSIRTV